MSLMPTAPRSIGGVLDDAIRLYRRALIACFPLVLGAVVLLTIPSVMLSLGMQSSLADPKAMLSLLRSPVVLIGYLAIMVVSGIVYSALIVQINALAHGKSLSWSEALGVGLKRLPSVIGVVFLFIVMITVGTILLIVPGIYLWGIFQLALIPVLIERAGVIESFGISRRLIKGNWWRTNSIVFVAFIILYVLIFTVAFIVSIAAGIPVTSTAARSTNSTLILQLVTSVLNLFTMTFLPCVYLAIYYDLKLRHEGADLADRVGALKSAR